MISTMYKKFNSKLNNKRLKFVNKLKNGTDLKQLIDNNDIISFDIFDTLIVRNVLDPVDIFTIVENTYNEKFDKLTFDFKNFRRTAEANARKISVSENGFACLNLDEIYSYIQQSQNLDTETIQNLKSIEIEIELKFCVQNTYMFEFYQYCLDNNKQVIITSDMYLPESVISQILLNNGYDQFSHLYLSSVVRKSKSIGSLYPHIIKDLTCLPSKVLHVGDYFYADIINAMKVGITAFYYQKSNDYALAQHNYKSLRALYPKQLSLEESIYFATIVNKIFTYRNNIDDKFWHDFGYIYCGLIYFSFTRWLTTEVVNSEIEKVFFLARDGYIMNESYRLLNHGKNLPPSDYMYASRRAINIPTINKDIDEQALKILCHPFPNLNVMGYLNRVDIDADSHLDKISQVGFSDKYQIIQSDKDKTMLANLFKLLVEDICTNSAIEREHLVKYLEQIDFINANKVAVVDIGWQGTIQNSITGLMHLLNKKTEIKGYYIGTFATAKQFIDKGLSISGYICNLSKPQQNFDVIDGCVHIFEFIFSAPHGSVIKFSEKDNIISPVCEPHNTTSKKSKIVMEFQQGALDFINDFKKIETDYKQLDISIESAIKPLSRLLKTPTYNEAVHLGNLQHSEYVGEQNYDTYFARSSSPLKMYLNPLQFKREYYASLWKIGFKKRYLGNILPKSFFKFLKPLKK